VYTSAAKSFDILEIVLSFRGLDIQITINCGAAPAPLQAGASRQQILTFSLFLASPVFRPACHEHFNCQYFNLQLFITLRILTGNSHSHFSPDKSLIFSNM
jgi:hypothetical protein